jgi:hypothetical protein
MSGVPGCEASALGCAAALHELALRIVTITRNRIWNLDSSSKQPYFAVKLHTSGRFGRTANRFIGRCLLESGYQT